MRPSGDWPLAQLSSSRMPCIVFADSGSGSCAGSTHHSAGPRGVEGGVGLEVPSAVRVVRAGEQPTITTATASTSPTTAFMCSLLPKDAQDTRYRRRSPWSARACADVIR
jgi:hypothetical protein